MLAKGSFQEIMSLLRRKKDKCKDLRTDFVYLTREQRRRDCNSPLFSVLSGATRLLDQINKICEVDLRFIVPLSLLLLLL